MLPDSLYEGNQDFGYTSTKKQAEIDTYELIVEYKKETSCSRWGPGEGSEVERLNHRGHCVVETLSE